MFDAACMGAFVLLGVGSVLVDFRLMLPGWLLYLVRSLLLGFEVGFRGNEVALCWMCWC